jgi:hypothetical protein
MMMKHQPIRSKHIPNRIWRPFKALGTYSNASDTKRSPGCALNWHGKTTWSVDIDHNPVVCEGGDSRFDVKIGRCRIREHARLRSSALRDGMALTAIPKSCQRLSGRSLNRLSRTTLSRINQRKFVKCISSNSQQQRHSCFPRQHNLPSSFNALLSCI